MYKLVFKNDAGIQRFFYSNLSKATRKAPVICYNEQVKVVLKKLVNGEWKKIDEFFPSNFGQDEGAVRTIRSAQKSELSRLFNYPVSDFQ